MGCGGSKLEETPAVAHCRQRSLLLADAIRHRYALADAHAAYARSLRAAGDALAALLLRSASALPPESPVLTLPTHRKGDDLPQLTPSPPPSVPFLGPHIDFLSSDSDAEEDSPLHSESGGATPHLHAGGGESVGPIDVGLSYSRSRPGRAELYGERPPSSEATRYDPVDEPPPTVYPYYTEPYRPQSLNFFGNSAYRYVSYDGVENDGFFGPSLSAPNIPSPVAAAVGGFAAASPKAPPPPSPPRTSTWDFLNPFDSYENQYDSYSANRSSRASRVEAGTPDLEDEQQEVIKEAYGYTKFAATSSVATLSNEHKDNDEMETNEGVVGGAREDHNQKFRPLPNAASSLEPGVRVVDKNVVTETKERDKAVGFSFSRSYQDIVEVMQEIKNQFDGASASADHVAKLLEVGKFFCQHKNSAYKVSARMICGLSPLSTSKIDDLLVFEEDEVIGTGYLSSTLQKIYNWELKLLEEVMVEEKMRVLYNRKCEQLNRLSKMGAEAEKLESVEVFIRKLSVKIQIAIQIVGSISSKINQVRDEELYPQVIELIHGFRTMWAVMSKCHQIQCQAISEAKNLDSIINGVKLNNHMDEIKRLEMATVDLFAHFSGWVTAQRSYLKSLNGWLMKGFCSVPEETDGGIAPFSPGKLGAPPIFIVCNYWSERVDVISERNVVGAMKAFAHFVFKIWQQHSLEQQQSLTANRDMDSKLRLMVRDEQLMVKHKNKLMLISSENDISVPEHAHHGSTMISFQTSLRHIFKAMEIFAASSAEAYEEHDLKER